MGLSKIYSSKYIGRAPDEVNKKYLRLDAKMQLGNKYLSEKNESEAVITCIEVWNELMDAMKRDRIKTFKEFDKVFNGHQFVSNWITDFDNCLWEIVSNNSSPEILESYGATRIFINEQLQDYLEPDEILAWENVRRAVAETHFYMGNIEKGKELFSRYLNENPKWGWGWIGWSDQYWLCKHEKADFKRGEEILLKALEVTALEDRWDVEDRLRELYSESEQEDKLRIFEEKLDKEDKKTKKN